MAPPAAPAAPRLQRPTASAVGLSRTPPSPITRRPPSVLLSRPLDRPQRCCRRRPRPRLAAAAAANDNNNNDADGSSSSTSVLGAAVLVAGTAVGAGILALPAATAAAGFAPSAVALTAGAAYSAATGLCIAEVALRTSGGGGGGEGRSSEMRKSRRRGEEQKEPQKQQQRAVSIQTMAAGTLGGAGATAASSAYLFLHYALLVAYVAKAGELLAGGGGRGGASAVEALGVTPDHLLFVDPAALAGAAFAASLGAVCFFASPAALDAANGAMFAGTVAAFGALVVLAATSAGGDGEMGGDAAAASLMATAADGRAWAAILPALPLVALAFVFHNVVPVVSASLGGNPRKIRSAIVWGVALPWVMLVAWEAATLGGGSESAAAEALQPGFDPLARLAASSDLAAPLIAAFSLGAVATSFLGFTLGLTTFFDDALPWLRGGGGAGAKQGGGRDEDGDDDGGDARPPASAFFLALGPPVVFAAANPGAFFSALDAAGTYGVLSLFGLLPPAMVWVERYGREGAGEGAGDDDALTLLPGGKGALLLIGGLAAAVMANSAAADVAAALAK